MEDGYNRQHVCLFFIVFMDPSVVGEIQRWVELDNKVELKKAKLKEYVDEKKTLEDKIVNYIEEHQKSNVQIKTSDGYINFQELKSQQTLTQKYIKEALTHFFEVENTKSSDVDIDKMVQFLMDNRETKTKVVMRRYITNQRKSTPLKKQQESS
jgi:hypothetical protein